MKKTKLLALLIVFMTAVLILTGCGAKEEENKTEENNAVENNMAQNTTPAEGYLTFDGNGWTISYKKDWTHETSGVLEMFLSPEGTSTVNVIKEDLPMTYTLDQYKAASLEQLKKQMQTSEIKEEKVTANGYEAYRIVYDTEVNSSKLTIKQTFMVKDKAAFVITFTGTSEAEKVYNEMENSIIIK